MKFRAFSFLADENISPDVVVMLRKEGLNVISVEESRWNGFTDRQLIQIAYSESRVILTHDSDFGKLAFAEGELYFGIVFLRPGHLPPEHTLEALRRMLIDTQEFTPPFIAVCKTFPVFRLRIRG